MKARAIFFRAAFACAVLTTIGFSIGWLWYEHRAEGWFDLSRKARERKREQEAKAEEIKEINDPKWTEEGKRNFIQRLRGEAKYQGDEAEAYDRNVSELADTSDIYLTLLQFVPASIIGGWLVISWIVFGREALQPSTILSHFKSLK